MRKIQLSLIITVFNEQNTILQFIESVFSQSKLADEFIIVDGGSTDATASVISNLLPRARLDSAKRGEAGKSQISNKKTKFKFIVKKGNRSVGRNEAIKNAMGEIILCSDAGCTLDKDWVKNIIKPFEDKSADVVAGYYKGKPKNIFQKCLIPYVLVMEDRISPNDFLPATRSIAFRKKIWEKAGGFPEQFSNNEDYVFAKKLKKLKVNILFEKKAIVYWIPRKNFKEAFIMFFRFALGDSESGILRTKVFLIFARYILAFYLLLLLFAERSINIFYLLIVAFFLYIIWSVTKNYHYVKDWRAIFFLPFLQLISDLAVLIGTLLGLIWKKN